MKFSLKSQLKMSTLVVIISLLLVCQSSSFEVIDRKSDEFFYFLTDPVTLSRDNITLKCNYVNLKSASLLLKHKDYALSFAKCENDRVYLMDGLDHYNNKGFDFTMENFSSKISKIGRLSKTFTKPLDHPIEVVVPGKILVVGRVNIDGLDYSHGVWQINLDDDESVMVNNVLVDVTTTTKNFEGNTGSVSKSHQDSSDFTHQISKRSYSRYDDHSEDEINEYSTILWTIKFIVKIIWAGVVIWLLCKYLKARKQEKSAPVSYIGTISGPGASVAPTAPQQSQTLV